MIREFPWDWMCVCWDGGWIFGCGGGKWCWTSVWLGERGALVGFSEIICWEYGGTAEGGCWNT